LEYIRAFISVDIIEEEILNKVEGIQRDLLATEADLKLVSRSNMHFTLKFLGQIQVNMVEEIFELIKTLDSKSFELEVYGLGCFTPKYPRVIWIGANKGAEELKKLQAQLDAKLRKLGFKPDREKYVPHATIARVKSGKNKAQLLEVVSKYKDFIFGEMKVNCITLKKSTLTPKGPIYENLKECFI